MTAPRPSPAQGTGDARDIHGLVGRRLDDYEVERVVATGGFGVVYFARHHTLKQPVAIKVLKVAGGLPDDERALFAQQFLEEAQTIAALKHPAIVGVLAFKVSPMPDGVESPWMALEWVEGETLAADLTRRRGQGGRSPAECLRLLEPVFDALAVAHARGIAHRDIKPANLMIPKVGTGGRFSVSTRVLDFGIAKGLDANETPGSGHTETTSPIQAFSLPYAAIEQVSGTRSGPWTDVHALALILVELLIDDAPYQAGDRADLMMQVMSPVRPTPARYGLDVGGWEPVIERALALKPGRRYPNAGEFREALEQNLPAVTQRTSRALLPTHGASGPQGTEALPSTTTAPASTDRPASTLASPRRNRVLAAAAGALLLVVAVTLTLRDRQHGATPAPVSAIVHDAGAPPDAATQRLDATATPTVVIDADAPAVAPATLRHGGVDGGSSRARRPRGPRPPIIMQ